MRDQNGLFLAIGRKRPYNKKSDCNATRCGIRTRRIFDSGKPFKSKEARILSEAEFQRELVRCGILLTEPCQYWIETNGCIPRAAHGEYEEPALAAQGQQLRAAGNGVRVR